MFTRWSNQSDLVKVAIIGGLFGVIIAAVTGGATLVNTLLSSSPDEPPSATHSPAPESPSPDPATEASSLDLLTDKRIESFAAPFHGQINECNDFQPEKFEQEIGLDLSEEFAVRCWGNDWSVSFISFRDGTARGYLYGMAEQNIIDSVQGQECNNQIHALKPRDLAAGEISIRVCFEAHNGYPAIYWEVTDETATEKRLAGVLLAQTRNSAPLLEVWKKAYGV